MPADIHGSVQRVTLRYVPVDVLLRLFLWFNHVKHLQCHSIHPPLKKVQCVHMYSVAWDVLVICTNHYLTETGWEVGGGAVCGKLGSCERSCGGELCGGEL